MKTKLAILGVGRWGKHYVRHFLNHPQAELVAIVDANPPSLDVLKQSFPLHESIILACQWTEIRQLEGLDAVVVVTPASTHYSLIKDALSLGYHVLSEKPLTLNPNECVELTQLAQQRNRHLFIDHTYLFHPATETGKTVVESGKLGKLRYGYASRTHIAPIRQDVDVLWDLAIHDIAIFNDWLEESPQQVAARGRIWLQSDDFNAVSPETKGLSDLVWVSLFYPSGVEVTLHLCWLNPDKQRRLCLVGEEGTLIFDEMSSDAPLSLQKGWLKSHNNQFYPQNLDYEVIPLENKEPLKQVCDRFLETIRTNKPNKAASGQKAIELVNILDHLSQSLEQQGRILSVNSISLDGSR